MDFLLRYIKLEFKRAYKSFPKMLLGAMVLVLIIGSLAYCSETLLYANNEHDRAKVALVVEDDSSLISMATTLLESSESISSVANFIRVKPKVVDKLIKNQDVIASVTVPEGFIDGLAKGEKVSINVKFSKNMHAFTGIFKELSLTATKTMASTQAGIYAQTDMYHAHNNSDKLSEANGELNKSYLGFVFSRNSIFDSVTVTSTGNVSIITYYLSGAIVLFFMMFSMAFSSFIMNDGIVLKKKLYASKLGVFGYYFSKITIVFSMYYIVYLILGIIGLLIGMNIFKIWLFMILVLFCLSSIIVLFFEMAPNKLTAIILVFILSATSAILSGCIVPRSYLPDTLAEIGAILPSTAMIDVVAGGLDSNPNLASLISLPLISVACYLVTILFEKKVRCKA